MPLNYQHTTFAQAKSILAQLLNDPNSGTLGGSGFWTNNELGRYIQEALGWWGSATGYWRDRASFNTSTATGTVPTADNPWYDLPTFLPTLRGYTTVDTTLVVQMQNHLLEPPGVPWTGSTQFALSDLTSALTKRRDQFLLETGIGITHLPVPQTTPNISLITLPDTVVSVRRAAWKTVEGTWSVLPRSDEWYMLGYYPQPFSQNVAQAPQVHSVAITPPLTVRVEPTPNDIGTLDLLVIKSGATLDGSGVAVGVHNDFAWAIKWGALADVLNSDGPKKDPLRAKYCQSRWEEGIAMAKAAVSVMLLSINNAPMYVEALDTVDSGRPLWQNYSGKPFMGVMAGLNLLGMVDPPNGNYSVTLDVVQNAIIPSAEGEFVQVGREELAVILGYAEHLAAFKCGGAEFMATRPNLDRALALAGTYNSKLKAATQPSLLNRAQQEKLRRPAMVGQ